MLRGQNNGVDRSTIHDMKSAEAPEFDQGRLIRTQPIRHKLPKHKFYYTNKEWFEPKPTLPKIQTKDAATNDKPEQITLNSPKPVESQMSLQAKINNNEITDPTKDFESEEYKKYNVKVPSKVYADSYIRQDAAKWKSTPVPGFRTCTYFDQYRNEALKHYDCLYNKNRGVLPKYGGYVPGLKFRYGSPFGQLTYNAREIGVPKNKSRTWGGAVSLF